MASLANCLTRRVNSADLLNLIKSSHNPKSQQPMERPVQTSILPRTESSGNFVAYDVKGEVTIDDIKDVHDELLYLIDRYKKLKLLVNMEPMEGMQPSAILEDLKFTLHFLNDFSAIAIVGDKSWQEFLARFSNVLTDYKIKYFDISNIKEAFDWIKGQ